MQWMLLPPPGAASGWQFNLDWQEDGASVWETSVQLSSMVFLHLGNSTSGSREEGSLLCTPATGRSGVWFEHQPKDMVDEAIQRPFGVEGPWKPGDLLYAFQQNEIDPCVFQFKSEETQRVVGLLLTHVDDLMLLVDPELEQAVKEEI